LEPLEKYVKEREAAVPTTWDGSLHIHTLRSLYTKGIITPEDVVNEVYKRLALPTADSAVWLHVFPQAEVVKRARELSMAYPDAATRHPLYGIPFSIKDNIDIKGVLTTAACPEYAYVAENDAPSYATLIEAGCIIIGKVNMVRFAFISPTILISIFLRKGSTCNRYDVNFLVALWSINILLKV
jgi:Asp-tRNA(Asn)/Glu-tRNA(Gln) amidotransferase A subunit family amidase